MPDPVPCIVCGSRDRTVLFRTRDRLLDLPGAYSYVRCAGCGLIFLDPPPAWEVREAHYAESYRGYEGLARLPSANGRRSLAYGLRKRQAVVEKYAAGGRLLDVGCAGGDFVDQVGRTHGWRAYGLERVDAIARAAGRNYGAPVMAGDIGRAGLAAGTFDAITLWTVLEHMQDPRQSLRECARLLRPGGVLVLRTLIAGSWGERIFGPCWVGYDAPRVLFVFTPATLRGLLGGAGFDVVETGQQFHDYYPYVWSWQNWCAEHLRGQTLRRIAVAAASSPLTRALTAPYILLQTKLKRNGYLTVVARQR